MRVTPTQEQMAYLASIGASSSTIPQPRPAAGKCDIEIVSHPHTTNRRVVHWWAVFLVTVVLLLSLVGIARTEEKTAPAGNETVENPLTAPQVSNVQLLKSLTALENELANVKETIGNGDDLRKEIVAAQTKIKGLESRFRETKKALYSDLTNDREVIGKKIQTIETAINQLKANLASLANEHSQWRTKIEADIESIGSQVDARVIDTKRKEAQIVDTEIATLRENLATQQQELFRTQILFGAITVLTIGLFILGRIIMEKRMRPVEMYAWRKLNEAITAYEGMIAPPHSHHANTDNEESLSSKNIVKLPPKRSQQQVPVAPDKQMAAIIAVANQTPCIRIKPTISVGDWELGLATSKGHVRAENQDYGLCFQTAGHNVLVVADGCGGIPHGQRASYLAAFNAAISVIRSFGMAPRLRKPHIKEVALKAIMDAAHSLAIEGDKLNITDVRGGLRTTLIVVISNQLEVGYAYIGDGGGCVVKSTGEVEHFLKPQKATGHAMNVLAASLGPSIEGEPVSGVLNRDVADLLLVGTDGIFDRVEAMFPKDVLRGCIQYHGDLQKAAEHIVEEMASFKDAAGYICDDNLTLGIMGDGTNPKLPNGFWTTPTEAESAHQELPSSLISAQMKEGVS